jgi:hypothetical protein
MQRPWHTSALLLLSLAADGIGPMLLSATVFGSMPLAESLKVVSIYVAAKVECCQSGVKGCAASDR